MTAFLGLCVWLMSLVVAAYLGFDRGRWATGLLLGLFFGPLGVVAAGLMQPSVECASRRAYALEQQLAERHRRARVAAEGRRQNQAQLDAWVKEVQRQIGPDTADQDPATT